MPVIRVERTKKANVPPNKTVTDMARVLYACIFSYLYMNSTCCATGQTTLLSLSLRSSVRLENFIEYLHISHDVNDDARPTYRKNGLFHATAPFIRRRAVWFMVTNLQLDFLIACTFRKKGYPAELGETVIYQLSSPPISY